MLSEVTQLRLVLVVWVCCMVALLGWQSWVLWIIVGIVGVAALTMAIRWYCLYSEEVDAQRRKAAEAEEELLARMQRQHNQAASGDDRGIYGDGYPTHLIWKHVTRPPTPPVPPSLCEHHFGSCSCDAEDPAIWNNMKDTDDA